MLFLLKYLKLFSATRMALDHHEAGSIKKDQITNWWWAKTEYVTLTGSAIQ